MSELHEGEYVVVAAVDDEADNVAPVADQQPKETPMDAQLQHEVENQENRVENQVENGVEDQVGLESVTAGREVSNDEHETDLSVNDAATPQSTTAYSLSVAELRQRGVPLREQFRFGAKSRVSPSMYTTPRSNEYTPSGSASPQPAARAAPNTPPEAATNSASSQSPASPASSSASSPKSQTDAKPTQEEGRFECNICFDQATDPVISLCGHLYCWPCIHPWIESQAVPLCPVCKAGIGADKVIPVYSRGGESVDPRKKPANIPNRPAGQRPPPQRQGNFPLGENQFFQAQHGFHHPQFHFSAGFGLFPSLFGVQFNLPGQPETPHRPLTPEEERQALASRFFLMLGFFILIVLLFF